MQYSVSNPVHTKLHFSALHHGDYGVVGRVVVYGCALSSRRERRNSTILICINLARIHNPGHFFRAWGVMSLKPSFSGAKVMVTS